MSPPVTRNLINSSGAKYYKTGGYSITDDQGATRYYKNGLLHREDGPAVIHPGGTKYWCQKGVNHRVGGPAVEWATGDKNWYVNGKLHREDGPAIERADGTRAYYLWGKNCTPAEYWKKVGGQKTKAIETYISPFTGKQV